MRIFRRAPNLKNIMVDLDFKKESKFVNSIIAKCMKRFMNITKLESVIFEYLEKENIDVQTAILIKLIRYIHNQPNGKEISNDMFVASLRAVQRIDISESLVLGESLKNDFFSIAVYRRMIGLYISINRLDRAKELLDAIPNSEWSNKNREKIESLEKLNQRILDESNEQSKFFNLIKPVNKPRRFNNITMACLFDRFTYDCLSREMNLLPINKSNWKTILSRPEIKYFFAESIWSGHDGGWKFAMSSFNTAAGSQLKEVLKYCKDNQIITIFWNKEDPVNYEAFIEVAKNFDYILTSDENTIEKYKEDCPNSIISSLAFAAQPLIHNPIRNSLPEHDICFAGSWYVREHGRRKEHTRLLIDASSKYGLHIFDRFHGTDNRNRFPSEYDDFVKGSLSYKETCMAYRAYKIFLNINSVDKSPTMFSRRVFEILASSTALVSTPSEGMEVILGDCIKVVNTKEQARNVIDELLENNYLRQRIAHLGYREVMNNHTYTHRLDKIFNTVGIETAKHEEQLVSCICVSNRPHLINDILSKFDSQNYVYKELILVLEASDESYADIENKLSNRNDVTVNRAYSHEILGALFNRGVEISKGLYIAKWDDDDLYGQNYLSDSLLAFNYSSASIVGKLESYMYHQGTDKLYLRFSNKRHRYQQLILGPTIIAKREVFDKVKFQERSSGEDTNFLKDSMDAGFTILATDPYNFIYWRSSNVKDHTWQPETDQLLKNTIEISSGLSTDEVFI